jgi:hypothetical protein
MPKFGAFFYLKQLLTYTLTYPIEQSHSSEANMFPANQEISRILWKANVH